MMGSSLWYGLQKDPRPVKSPPLDPQRVSYRPLCESESSRAASARNENLEGAGKRARRCGALATLTNGWQRALACTSVRRVLLVTQSWKPGLAALRKNSMERRKEEKSKICRSCRAPSARSVRVLKLAAFKLVTLKFRSLTSCRAWAREGWEPKWGRLGQQVMSLEAR